MTPKPSARDVFESSVCDIIARQMDVPRARVVPEARLVVDFGADLVALTQLALALEDEFDIEIVDTEWIDVERVVDVVEYVRACRDRAAARPSAPR